ncbi:hypothetical protein [Xanthobacter autotrophicus]|uniref:hypothetical protein n=1 Tax=Xanthobacter autotrophicus TaxID=280 RepID=UPI00372ADA10
MTQDTAGPAAQSPSLPENALLRESQPPVSRRTLLEGLLGGGVLLALALVPEPAQALRIPRGLMMVPGMLRIPMPSRRAPSGGSSAGRSRSGSGSGSASKKSGSGSRKNRKDQDPPSDTASREPDAGARDPRMPASRTSEPAAGGGASAASSPTGPGAGPASSGGGPPPSGPPQIAGGGVPAAAGAGAGGAAAAATGGRQVITDGDY